MVNGCIISKVAKAVVLILLEISKGIALDLPDRHNSYMRFFWLFEAGFAQRSF